MGSIASKLFIDFLIEVIAQYSISIFICQAGGAVPQILQTIDLKAVSTDRCKKIFGGRNVHESHICTLTKVGEGACHGDSGNSIPKYDL